MEKYKNKIVVLEANHGLNPNLALRLAKDLDNNHNWTAQKKAREKIDELYNKAFHKKKAVIGDKKVYTKRRLKAAMAHVEMQIKAYEGLRDYLKKVKPID